jgi:hypothetical protein
MNKLINVINVINVINFFAHCLSRIHFLLKPNFRDVSMFRKNERGLASGTSGILQPKSQHLFGCTTSHWILTCSERNGTAFGVPLNQDRYFSIWVIGVAWLYLGPRILEAECAWDSSSWVGGMYFESRWRFIAQQSSTTILLSHRVLIQALRNCFRCCKNIPIPTAHYANINARNLSQ